MYYSTPPLSRQSRGGEKDVEEGNEREIRWNSNWITNGFFHSTYDWKHRKKAMFR